MYMYNNTMDANTAWSGESSLPSEARRCMVMTQCFVLCTKWRLRSERSSLHSFCFVFAKAAAASHLCRDMLTFRVSCQIPMLCVGSAYNLKDINNNCVFYTLNFCRFISMHGGLCWSQLNNTRRCAAIPTRTHILSEVQKRRTEKPGSKSRPHKWIHAVITS